jgi:nicotinate-nucleotide adenylyltransferase
MTKRRRVGLFGGTFDPCHLGHLAVARDARDTRALDEVRLVPAHVPPHRAQQPHASAHHRFAMAALGTAEHESLVVSDVELAQAGPSYTTTTLSGLAREGLRPCEIFFITGADAFAEIETWHDYPRLLDGAHFVVLSRPGRSAASLRDALPALAGRMVAIRDADDAARAEATAAPDTVIMLVDARTPAVSATAVRAAVRAGHSIDGLVPPLVARHIRKHRLYINPSLQPAADGDPEAATELHEQEHA